MIHRALSVSCCLPFVLIALLLGGAAPLRADDATPAAAVAEVKATVEVPHTEKAFFGAVAKGRLEAVRAALDAHPDWVRSREHHWEVPAINVAAWDGHTEIVRLLIERGSDVNATHERWQWYPIHEAAAGGHVEIIRMLLDHGARIDVVNIDGHTPLSLAAESGEAEAAKLLIERGIKTDWKDKDDWTLLHYAARSGSAEFVRLLLDRGLDADVRNNMDRTPLFWAVSVEAADALMLAGAEVDLRDKAGRTPLHMAAFFGRTDVALCLLKRGAEISAVDAAGRTPLDLAGAEGYTETASRLADAGAEAGDAPNTVEPITRIGPRGQVYLRGKPVFPFGVWMQPRILFEYHHHLGVTCLVCHPGTGDPGAEAELKYNAGAKEVGLGTFLFYHDELVDDENVWGWMGGGWPVREAMQNYEKLRRKDPRRIQICNFGSHGIIKGDADAEEFYRPVFRYVDAICPHVWPEIFEDEGHPRDLRMVVKMVDNARRWCSDRPRGEVSIWADISLHEWRKKNRPGLYPTPTPKELKFMIWAAIVHGADGICLFPISFDPFVFAQIPAKIEEALPKITREITDLAPVIAAAESPRAITVTGSNAEGIVDMTTRRHEGVDYVFVVNGTDEPQTMTLEVEGLGSELGVYEVLKDREAKVRTEGRIERKFGGLEVRIWKLVPKD